MSGGGGGVLDLLVVGGGPGGTAAAFRATELGLAVAVVDYDDLMKRIRDYSKDKLILPGFGGGDQLAFPAGGELVSALRFAPIDKDEMCESWKGLYQRHGVPFRCEVELLRLDRDGEAWAATLFDHRRGAEEVVSARHVVLALGRGVPRRLDIPGDTGRIPLRLEDPGDYVGAPACVIGGGTSAAEAVIAISNAKRMAGDATGIYWSYRGEKMPRVSHALAEVFFEAYVGNGNIHYCRRSEPVAVVVGDDREEYLAIRVDRRVLADRPPETVHLEFPKRYCLACIGVDLPEDLLASLGVPLVAGGSRGRRRLAVTRCLETVRPQLYAVGDLLSQAYLECDDFASDPAGWREVKHRGNIKTALRDGVKVAEVVRRRLDGDDPRDVAIGDLEDLPIPARVQVVVAAASSEAATGDLGGSPPAQLVQLLRDGVHAEEHPLADTEATTIGRAGCILSFPDDGMLSPRHATVLRRNGSWVLRDEGSASGVFLFVPSSDKLVLTAGDLLCAGRQFLVVDEAATGLVQYDAAGRLVARHALPEGRAMVFGRDAPDVVLDKDDQGLSRRHFALSREEGRLRVKDLKSLNGTLLRVRQEVTLDHGARFRVGHQQFALSLDPDAPLDTAPPPPPRVSGKLPALQRSAPLPSAAGPSAGPTVSFRGQSGWLPVPPGQTVCDVAEQQGLTLLAECHSGICGSDPVRLLAGAEHVLAEASDQERETLEDLCGLEPGPCRLACMLRVRGPVEVEVVKR